MAIMCVLCKVRMSRKREANASTVLSVAWQGCLLHESFVLQAYTVYTAAFTCSCMEARSLWMHL